MYIVRGLVDDVGELWVYNLAVGFTKIELDEHPQDRHRHTLTRKGNLGIKKKRLGPPQRAIGSAATG